MSQKKMLFSGHQRLLNLSEIRYVPRWLVLIIDIFLLGIALFLSYYTVQKMNVMPYRNLYMYQKYVLIISVNVFFMVLFHTYSGIIRHSTFVDLFKILAANFLTFVVLQAVNLVCYWTGLGKIILTPVLFLFFAVSTVILFFFRLFVKETFHLAREFKKQAFKNRILVLGIDERAISTARAIMDNPNIPFYVAGFLTQRNDSSRARILGKKIYNKEYFTKYGKDDLDISGVLIIKEMMSKEEMNSWVNFFLEKDLKVYKAPSVQKLRKKDFVAAIKSVQIEDLLNRKPISLENEDIKRRHFDKVVLITGGAGSIGSEIVRQVARFRPSLVVVLDQAETPLYDIELEMTKNHPDINFKFILADITNLSRLEPIFQQYNFSMVYHAAAYKHVPLVEENPHEGVLANICGTKNVATLSSKYHVNRFVMISTDKAVNPTNVMGATKRAAELFVQALQNVEGNTTKFITTRFGNVLGSNGSVIPHFKRQIENGGPVTITHPDIVRYFMTIPEACELVLQAGTMGQGGEIYVFDMGEPVKILDLAKRMIKLSGFEPDNDIEIVFTGLRPGEKLYEELLSDDTRTMPTHSEKIMISKDAAVPFLEIDRATGEIISVANSRDKMEIVRLLKAIVPEYKSNNSIYEKLDN